MAPHDEIQAPGSIEAVAALASLARELVATCAWTVLTRLPVAAALCVLACLILAAVPGYVLVTGVQSSVAGAWLAVLVPAYLLAGLLWGLHRALRRTAAAGLDVITRRSPEVIDSLLAPLVQRGGSQIPQVDIAEARRRLGEASEKVFDAAIVPRWRWLRCLTSAAARWSLRAELAVAEHVLCSIERRGESQLSVASFTAYARDEVVARTRSLAEVNLRQLDLLAALVVFGLLVVPAALLPLLAR